MQTKRITVTAEWIREYSEAIEFPLQTFGQKLVAPSTMPILFWQSFDVPIFRENRSILHGSQQFTYKHPLLKEWCSIVELQLTNKEHKNGKQGPLTFYTYTLICYENGKEIVEAKTLLIQVGASS